MRLTMTILGMSLEKARMSCPKTKTSVLKEETLQNNTETGPKKHDQETVHNEARNAIGVRVEERRHGDIVETL